MFALFIELLAQVIRESNAIAGVQIGETQSKICLFADDILLTLTEPKLHQINPVSKTLDHTEFEYKLNLSNFKLLSLIINHMIALIDYVKWKGNIVTF